MAFIGHLTANRGIASGILYVASAPIKQSASLHVAASKYDSSVTVRSIIILIIKPRCNRHRERGEVIVALSSENLNTVIRC